MWVAAWLLLTWYVHRVSDGIAPKPGQPPVVIFSALGHFFERSTANVTIYGFLPVVPMVLGSAVVMVLFSLLTPAPSRATIEKYFPTRNTGLPDSETPAAIGTTSRAPAPLRK